MAVFFSIGCLLLAQNIGPLFFPNRCDAHEELKIDTWHWAGKHREVFFVEEVVDHAFERPIGPRAMDGFFERDVAHIVFW